MKVYKIRADVGNYQSLLLSDDALAATDAVIFDGMPKASTWKPIELYCLYPKLKQGDFYGFVSGTLVIPPATLDKTRMFFEMAGELLPVIYNQETWYLINILECINALDQDRSEWLLTEDGRKVSLRKYAFHQNRFVVSSLFKVPETCRAHILTYERSKDPDEEFKAFVESEGLTGLVFEEVWNG